jgi:hypothetical protein
MADSASKRRGVRTRLRSVRRGDTAAAVRCAAWLGIVYKASFANFTAAHGWLTPAKRLIGSSRPSLLHASTWLAQALEP